MYMTLCDTKMDKLLTPASKGIQEGNHDFQCPRSLMRFSSFTFLRSRDK